ncbi:MATE family efflux transporter [Endozoicomonas lisbonensis]|uniref:Multidrug export protein MepA n=1 Tax=Endozoicomonas lisbonensis TaxID=3120522 RepID=A0ABV2SKG1_9GAMM
MSSVAVNLGADPVPTCFRHYLLPSVMGMMIKSVYIISDLIFIGQSMGHAGLAAINIVIPYFTFMFSVAMSIGVSGSALMAIRFGEGRKQEGLIMFQQAFSLTGITMMLFTVFTLLELENISCLFGANEELLPLVKDYLGMITLFATPCGMGWAMSGFIRNDDNPGLVMLAMISSASTNVFLDWLFLFPFGWGMKGAACATGIAEVVMLGTLLLHFRRPKQSLKLKLVLPDWHISKLIFKNGVSTFVMESAVGVVIMVSNWVLLRLGGNLFVSVYTIALNCTWVVVLLVYGVGQATQPIISFNYGAGLNHRIQEIIKLGFGLAMVIGLTLSLGMVVFAHSIVALFVDKPSAQLLALGGHVLRLYALSFVPMCISLMTATLYQSVDKPAYSTVISMLRALVLPLAGVFLLPTLFMANAVWYNFLQTEVMTALISVYFLKRFWDQLR